MQKDDYRILGWILVVVGAAMSFKGLRMAFILKYPLRVVMAIAGPRLTLFTIAGIAVTLIGIIMVLSHLEHRKKEYWEKKSVFGTASAKKRIEQSTDLFELKKIAAQAPSAEVQAFALKRRRQVLEQLLSSGSDQEAIGKEVERVITSGMYDKDSTDFLARAAKEYPKIVMEYWPKLKSWAHSDSKTHTDKAPGIHTDRTDYYDYIRYPDGRTVANKGGRRRHTDTRSSYSDCHDDSHADQTKHSDLAHEEKIERFRPYTGQ